jgi:hypothetical protein
VPETDNYWNGDRDGNWRRERGYWENGKSIPPLVEETLKEKLAKHILELKGVDS